MNRRQLLQAAVLSLSAHPIAQAFGSQAEKMRKSIVLPESVEYIYGSPLPSQTIEFEHRIDGPTVFTISEVDWAELQRMLDEREIP